MLKLYKRLNRREWLYLFIIISLITFQSWLDLKMPDYMAEITRYVQSGASEFNGILGSGSMMIILSLASLVSAVLTGLFTSLLAANLSMKIRDALFKKTIKLSESEIKKFKISSLITRTTNDITQVQMFTAMGLHFLIKSPLMAVMAIIKIWNKNWQWSTLTAVGVVILLSVVSFLIAVVTPKFKIVQKLTDKLNGVTRESLTGIRVIRAFNAEKYQEDKFRDVNNKLTNQQLFNQKMFAIMQPLMYLIMYGLTLGIYFIGANLINNAGLSEKLVIFGDMIVFSTYAMHVIMSFLMLAFIFMVLPRASVSASRINEVLDTDISIVSGTFNDLTKESGTVEFKNVYFRFPDGDDDLLCDINFKVNKGETFAILGSTGSGKSALIDLIPRMYDVTSGEVLVDGVNVKDYDLKYLNNKIGFVTQKAILFNGTVASNISYGKNLSKKQLEELSDVAQAKDFILKMDKQYNSHIASGGTNVSGGQKQRLAIARAIAKMPEIYIFDDSFSALDYKTDSKLRKALKEYTNGATTIIVAQRIGTVMNADKIIVLDEGKIVGMGKHKDLLKSCKVYREIAESQLSLEELENE